MSMADRNGLPVAISTLEASKSEVKLVEETLSRCFTNVRVKRLIGDMAHDSEPIDKSLRRNRKTLTAPHRYNRIKNASHDGLEPG